MAVDNTQKDPQSKSRHRRGGRRHGSAQAKPNPNGKQTAPQSAPKPQISAPKGVDTAKQRVDIPRVAAKDNDDVGFELISRRAPAQKYANFEEYMKAHE